MRERRASKIVGVASIGAGALWLFMIIVLPIVDWIKEPETRHLVGFIFFAVAMSIPAWLGIYNGYQLTQRCNRDNIKRAFGCICIISVIVATSALGSAIAEDFYPQWIEWIFLVAAILGISAYALGCRKLLNHEGFQTNLSQLFGPGQLSLLSFLLWLSLSSTFEVSGDGPLIIVLARGFGPFIAAIVFFKLGNRWLQQVQRRAFQGRSATEARYF